MLRSTVTVYSAGQPMRRGYLDGQLLASLIRTHIDAGPWDRQSLLGCSIYSDCPDSSILCVFRGGTLVIESLPDRFPY